MNSYKYFILFAIFSTFLGVFGCTEDSNDTFVPPPMKDLEHENDVYNQFLFDEYGCAVRWRWNDNFVKPSQRATPIHDSLVQSITRLVEYLWVEPYESAGEAGKVFMKELFPSELVYLGSYIYKSDGTRLLGYAEGGVRITLLNLNSFDLGDAQWLINPTGGILATVHHEFSHIVHQNYGMPKGFNEISDEYLGTGWSNGTNDDDALKLGMVSPYGTKSEHEDFCEIVSHYLTLPSVFFNERFIDLVDVSTITDPDDKNEAVALNAGRMLVKQKLEMIKSYYADNFDFHLDSVQVVMEQRLLDVIGNEVIPEKK